MEKIRTLYYERFIQHLIDKYSSILKSAKPGHCIKITGLALKELIALLPQLRPINPAMEVYILSEDRKGDEYIHATKLIELRNDPDKAILILVPSNSSTSAEDSYGDATFLNLSASSLQESFYWKLYYDMPQSIQYKFNEVAGLIKELKPSLSTAINYLIYLDLCQYSDEAWGNGLFLFGMLPDSGLTKDFSSIRRRFLLNLEKVSNVLADFSMPASDRVSSLPLKKDPIRKDLMQFLSTEKGIDDAVSLFENIHDNHPEFNYAVMPWFDFTNSDVRVEVNLAVAKTPKPDELFKDKEGNYILTPTDKKGKVSFEIVADPSPKDNPDIFSFEIALVNVEDFSEIGVLKKAKVGTNKRASRKLSINIAKDDYPDGEYMIRVRALDENGFPLIHNIVFKEDRVQRAWLDALQENPNLEMELFRVENHVAYCNESEVFTIDNQGEEGEEGPDAVLDKRAKVNSITQAIIDFRCRHISKGEPKDLPEEGVESNQWQDGNLTNTFTFDFGPNYAYQINLSKKLMQLERVFLDNGKCFGSASALLTANATDLYLLDNEEPARQSPRFIKAEGIEVPDELVELRAELFQKIKDSADDGTGLTSTFDFISNIGLVKSYLTEYDIWISGLLDRGLSAQENASLQNIDTAILYVEMPDSNKQRIKLLTPLHPLRLAWMVNLYELYQDWEEKTENNPKYQKAWYRKLDRLFQGQLPMDIAPLVFCDKSTNEAFQYIGELTFGWGAYAQPISNNGDSFASGYRQLKSYTSMLLNINKDRQIDGDVSLQLVYRHLFNYGVSHPYIDKCVINIFNAGDAIIFAKALIELEKNGIGKELKYEIRLFADDDMLQTGDAFKDLLDPDKVNIPEAEVFAQASDNKLFPKLRFSINRISDFVNAHDNYQAHISFLVNPFAVHTELARENELSRSFYLNGTICRSVVDCRKDGKSYVWDRYYSNKSLTNPVSESANLEVSLFKRLQMITGSILSSTFNESVPATELRLNESDMMLLSFVHECSDWVITFDKNMGPEFYDLPCTKPGDVPYLLDYIPGEDATGLSSYLTTKPTSEIESLMIPLFKQFGIDLTKHKNFNQILEDIRTVSSSLIMQVNATSNKGFEIIGTALAKRFLSQKHILATKDSILIPIDLHQELFVDLDSAKQERADSLLVNIDVKKRELLFTVVEIKCRNSVYDAQELHNKMLNQMQNTILALRTHFDLSQDGMDRLDRELKTLELKTLLEFYIRRSERYQQLTPENKNEYLIFLSKLAEGYSIRFKQLGIIFDFQQSEYQKKDFYGDATIYTMGEPVLDMILDDKSTLRTEVLEQQGKEFQTIFETRLEADFTVSDNNMVQNDEAVSEPQQNDPVTDDVSEIVIPQQPSATFGSDNPQQPIEQPEETNKTVTCNEPEEPFLSSQKSDPNYQEPKCEIIIGKSDESPQYGVLGKIISNGRMVGLDLNDCSTISLFGVQGAGKSYTIGSVTEMVLSQFSNVNKLPAPMASVIFHYSDSMDYAPEFTSMVYPNDEAKQLAKLKSEYGAEPGSIKDVILLAPESQVETRKAEYPDLEVFPIGFDSSELSVKDWLFLLSATGNDSTYIRELKQIMRSCRNNMSLQNLKDGVANDPHFTSTQRSLAEQRLAFAEDYITDGNKLQQHLKPGRLIIVDLRDEFIEKAEALGLFVVMLDIFSGVTQSDGKRFNKFIVFDEAHKYMNDKELVDSITTAIREMRHKGVSIMIASQDPMSLPTEVIELSSIVVMHKFSSPAWVKHVQKAITPLQTLTPTEMASLGSGEAYLWANKSTDKSITQRPVKISIRPRVTKHGGDTIQAVK